MRKFCFFLLLLGTCLAAPARPSRSRLQQRDAELGPHSHSFPAFSVAASPSPKIREEDEEEEQLDRLRHLEKAETEAESQSDTPAPPSATRHSSGSASGEEIDRTPKGEKRESNLDSYRKYAGVKYTPADLADYIARTGDEESVALAVEELLREGIFTRAQAISYLQEVKNARDRFRRERKEVVAGNRQETDKKSEGSPDTLPVRRVGPTRRPAVSERSGNKYGVQGEQEEEEAELERILEKMRATASAGEEYALEEMVFRLSKDTLARSLLRGDPTAEESPGKIATFLESRASDGHISADSRRRILDAVSAALVDTLKELSETPSLTYSQVPPGADLRIPMDSGKGRVSSGRKSSIEEEPIVPSSRE